MKLDSERGRDLGLRLCVFFEHFCNMQKLEMTKPVPAVVELIVSLMEEKK